MRLNRNETIAAILDRVEAMVATRHGSVTQNLLGARGVGARLAAFHGGRHVETPTTLD